MFFGVRSKSSPLRTTEPASPRSALEGSSARVPRCRHVVDRSAGRSRRGQYGGGNRAGPSWDGSPRLPHRGALLLAPPRDRPRLGSRRPARAWASWQGKREVQDAPLNHIIGCFSHVAPHELLDCVISALLGRPMSELQKTYSASLRPSPQVLRRLTSAVADGRSVVRSLRSRYYLRLLNSCSATVCLLTMTPGTTRTGSLSSPVSGTGSRASADCGSPCRTCLTTLRAE